MSSQLCVAPWGSQSWLRPAISRLPGLVGEAGSPANPSAARTRPFGEPHPSFPASLLLLLLAATAHAQNFSQRGFLETTALLFPQTAPNDSARAVGEALFRYEAFYKLTNLSFAAALDARTDTHHETDRDWGGAWWDRSRRRPLLAVRPP